MIIAKDIGGDWHYITEPKPVYLCIDKDGKQIGKIYPEYLPDPVKIWEQKCALYEVMRDSDAGKKMRPNQVVWKLFEHSQEVLNADNNN